MEITVIICAHNPRPDYLGLTLQGLRSQTLPLSSWELILIHNASDKCLETTVDLSWHPLGRHVREEDLGLMPARLRGAAEARGDLLVYVDDDNVLSTNYLQSALELLHEFPWLGTFGAATISPQYELEPEPRLRYYCGILALRDGGKDLFTNLPILTQAKPLGAGMCVRKEIALALQTSHRSVAGKSFGRRGTNCMGGEDFEFSLKATDLGFGYGVFARLSLIHLIPAKRTRFDYLLRIHEETSFSVELIYRIRDREIGRPAPSKAREVARYLGWTLKIIRAKGTQGKLILWRNARGSWKALREFRRLSQSKSKWV